MRGVGDISNRLSSSAVGVSGKLGVQRGGSPIDLDITIGEAVGGEVHELAPALLSLGNVRYLVPLKIVADFALFSPVYVLLLIAFRHVTTIDRNNFMGLLNFGVEFLRHPVRERVKIYR